MASMAAIIFTSRSLTPFMGRQPDRQAVIHIAPFRMMVGFFGLHRDARHQREGFGEILEVQFAVKGVAGVVVLPVRMFGQCGFDLLG